jgi:hypothetical protein
MTERYQDGRRIECLFADTFYKKMMEDRYGLSVCEPEEDPDIISMQRDVFNYLARGGTIFVNCQPSQIPFIMTSDCGQPCYNVLRMKAPGSYVTTIGDGVNTTFTILHKLRCLDVMIEVYNTASGETQYPDVQRIDYDRVIVLFNTPPPLKAFRVLISLPEN